MKLLLLMFSTLFISLALAACGGNAPNVPTSVPISPATAAATSAAPTAPPNAPTAAAATSAPANTPDNSVPTLAPNAPNTSFETAKALDTKPLKVSVKDSTFFFKVDVPRGGVISSTLSVDNFSPAPATLTLYDEVQNYLKQVAVPVGRSMPLKYVFGSKGGGTTYLSLSGNSSVTLQAVPAPQNDGATKADASDEFAGANTAPLGTLTGLLGDADHTDVFVIELPVSGGVLSTTVKTSDGDLKLTIYDANQNYIGEAASTGNKPQAGAFQHVLALNNGGRWFAQVNGEGAYTLTLAFTPQNDAGSAKDAANNFDQSLAIKTGSFNGLLGNADTEDYYSIDLSKSGGTFSLTLRTTNGSVKATVYDENQNFIGEVSSDKTKTGDSAFQSILAAEQGGKWYVAMTGEGAYAFSLAFAAQNDAGSGKDAPGTSDFALAVNSGQFSGSIGGADQADYFKVPASLGRKVTVNNAGKDTLRVQLYDQNENFVRDADVKSGASGTLTEDSGSTGEYFVAIVSGNGSYTVSITK